MLIKSNSRFFVRHELLLKAQRDRGVPLPLLDDDEVDVLTYLRLATKAGTATHVLEKDDVIELTKVDIREKDNIAILLFQRSDPDAPPPVFANKKKKTLRQVEKEADEAEAVSAHLFLSLDGADEDGIWRFRAIMEEVPGLGRSYMHAVIADVLRVSRYTYEDDRGAEHETYTIPTFHGVKSEKIGKALQDGVISFVELVRPPDVSGLDTSGLIPRPERMRLSLKTQSMQNSLNIIKRVQGWLGKHHWKDMRVQVKTGDNRSRLVAVARTEDAADVLFVHAVEVTTNKPISQCSEKVNEELVALAKKMFDDDKKGK